MTSYTDGGPNVFKVEGTPTREFAVFEYTPDQPRVTMSGYYPTPDEAQDALDAYAAKLGLRPIDD